jgi:hypothetical protein
MSVSDQEPNKREVTRIGPSHAADVSAFLDTGSIGFHPDRLLVRLNQHHTCLRRLRNTYAYWPIASRAPFFLPRPKAVLRNTSRASFARLGSARSPINLCRTGISPSKSRTCSYPRMQSFHFDKWRPGKPSDRTAHLISSRMCDPTWGPSGESSTCGTQRRQGRPTRAIGQESRHTHPSESPFDGLRCSG